MPKGKIDIVPFAECDKKEKLKRRKAAYKKWAINAEDNDSERRLTIIGNSVGMTPDEIREYRLKDNWEERFKKDKVRVKEKVKEKSRILEKKHTLKESTNKVQEILSNANIPNKWELFIMYYLQCHNALQASRMAGYEGRSNSVAFNILNDPRVQKAIREIKELMATDLYVTAHDVLHEYARIAFADMTQFVEFRDNILKLKDSTQVDGRLITEVSQGRDGIKIKLADKMKALEKMEKLFNVIPDLRLELDRQRYELSKKIAEKEIGGGETKTVIINDLGI